MGKQDREQAERVRRRAGLGDYAASLHPPGAPACMDAKKTDHRATDWRLADVDGEGTPGAWCCGLCHPPPEQLQIQLRRDVDPWPGM